MLEFERGAGIFSPRLRSQLKRVGDAMAALHAGGLCRDDDVQLQARFGEVCADLDAFEMLELKTLGRLEPGQNPGPVSSMLKLRASRLKQAVGELGVEMLGLESQRWRDAEGLADGDAVRGKGPREAQDSEVIDTLLPEFLNSRAYTIFGGAAEVQLGIIAKSSLGL
nr:acyl-CoA dehydrogenase family protein [Cupriavidus basilensis]